MAGAVMVGTVEPDIELAESLLGLLQDFPL